MHKMSLFKSLTPAIPFQHLMNHHLGHGSECNFDDAFGFVRSFSSVNKLTMYYCFRCESPIWNPKLFIVNKTHHLCGTNFTLHIMESLVVFISLLFMSYTYLQVTLTFNIKVTLYKKKKKKQKAFGKIVSLPLMRYSFEILFGHLL